MRKKLYMVRFACCLLLAISVFSSTKANPAAFPVTAKVQVVVAPVLKGMTLNPVIRIAVAIPAGNAVQHYRSLPVTVNSDAIDDIEKIEVYLTAAEPFNTTQRLAAVSPQSSSFLIPITLDLKPGLHFIWFSMILKSHASLHKKIELHCRGLIDDHEHLLRAEEGNNGFAKRTGIAIRRAGDDGVHTFRIPGVVKTGKGTLIAVYDVRYNSSGDLPGNIDVGMSRSIDGGNTWQPMKIIMDMGGPNDNSGIGDPCVLYDAVKNKIWVAALWSKGNHAIAGSMPGLSPDVSGQLVLVNSSDDGLSWSSPVIITDQVKNPAWHILFQGPGSGIMMKDGRLVFPAQYWDSVKMPHSTIVFSDDHGDHWKIAQTSPKPNTTENQVVETTPGTLMLNMRDNRGGFRSVSTTNNMGREWTEHATSFSALPDPVCMGSIIKAKVKLNGVLKEVLFFSNPNTSSGRYNITIRASTDLGEHWLPANQLLIDERSCYGYSSLVKIDDDTIGILYEGNGELYFVTVPVREIIKSK